MNVALGTLDSQIKKGQSERKEPESALGVDARTEDESSPDLIIQGKSPFKDTIDQPQSLEK